MYSCIRVALQLVSHEFDGPLLETVGQFFHLRLLGELQELLSLLAGRIPVLTFLVNCTKKLVQEDLQIVPRRTGKHHLAYALVPS